ncbi:MAG TPA: hypothetical protein VN841_08150 [Bryobacteraceae bacterium]|nr:hypothetical protein [Bryobacteraceae bacterium]
MLSRRKTAMSGLRQVSGSRLIIRRLARSLNRQLDEARAIGKLEDYAGIGVPEAWLLSPEAQSVEIRRLIEGKLATTALLVAGDLHPTRFPEVAIPVGSVWPEEILKS